MKVVGLLALAFGLAAVPMAFAQETKSGEKGTASSGEEGKGHLSAWNWANFVVLAGGLGYLAGKNAGPFFAARGQRIRDDMAEAGGLLQEAEARAAEVERRLAGLEADLASLRAESLKEAEEEAQRAALQTEAEIAKIRAQAEREIESAGRAARLELRRYAAHLAVELAEGKVRGRMTPSSQQALVAGFARDLDRPSPRSRAT
ncbi:MAG: ATP synthase F0 subunit B [Bryobacteraceae bacterium]|jgi:F0F1-type ATP synthase membrane subunit b/b'